MLQSAIEYLLTLRDPSGQYPICLSRSFQVIIPNVPPRLNFIYSVAPPRPIRAYILYEFSFGQAMVPHAFNVRLTAGAPEVINIIVSGLYTTTRTNNFIIIGRNQPSLNITVTNMTNLVQYYELSTHFLVVQNDDDYNTVLDALRRMNTSRRSEGPLTTTRIGGR